MKCLQMFWLPDKYFLKIVIILYVLLKYSECFVYFFIGLRYTLLILLLINLHRLCSWY